MSVVDDEFVVPEALRPAVVAAIPAPDGADGIDDAEPALLTVRVALDGTEPQVWRRIELDSEKHLTSSTILQVTFDWDDSHASIHRGRMHFRARPPTRRQRRMCSCRGRIEIGDLLTAPGNRMILRV